MWVFVTQTLHDVTQSIHALHDYIENGFFIIKYMYFHLKYKVTK